MRVHSKKGSQYISHDLQTFLKANNLQASMSRRGTCHDNIVAENLFQLLKLYVVRTYWAALDLDGVHLRVNESSDTSIRPETTHVVMWWITLSCFTTAQGGIVLMECFRL
jgi:transposase InsO family protein